ncbi:putative RDD family membrane protein YckC [Azomonas agilis]|uniref:Putative RDD family membrane protein YckC n=1 Tax=Azomonas agilis TaxID=116849 RepID=A0A562J1U6_9GAMM|nr:RDD family protein [Azomonas agilis]TWH76834.1 putative RDD family membrane protein YckC [Azomonas agilis]
MDTNEYEYAGFWVRAGASIIDTILTFLITAPALIYIYGWCYYTDENSGIFAGPADILISWVFPTVAVIIFWIFKQATPGKMAVSAKIVDAKTGNPASPAQLIGRYFAYLISIIPLFLGIIWVAFDKRKQGWHDKLAGTVVIKKVSTGSEPVKFESA